MIQAQSKLMRDMLHAGILEPINLTERHPNIAIKWCLSQGTTLAQNMNGFAMLTILVLPLAFPSSL